MAHPRSLTQALPVALALISALAGLPAPAQAGTLTGHYRENTTKGALTTPFQEFYEWNVFLCPMGQRGELRLPHRGLRRRTHP